LDLEAVRTVVCKLQTSEEEAEKLLETLKAFRDACNHISKVAYERRVFNPVALHHFTYRDVRERFGLPANLAIRARDRVAKAYKHNRSRLLEFKSLSMDLDERVFRLIHRPDGIYASIAVLQPWRRVKPKLAIGEYQRRLLEDAKPTHAVLVYRDKDLYLHITIKRELPDPEGWNPVGVDIGLRNLLVASNGFRVEGGAILHRRHEFRRLRETLQRIDTKNVKRRLKRLSGRERRWMKTILHEVSRRFVDSLRPGDIVVMENLNGIRSRVRVRREQRADLHTWAFRRLQFYIEYKALERGIPVVYIDAKNTSITCPRCGCVDRRNRRSQALFRCVNCGFQHNADQVASLNLSHLVQAPDGRAPVSGPKAGISGFGHYDSPASSPSLVGSS